MCTDRITRSIVVKKDIIAWKRVGASPTPGIYRSFCHPNNRAREEGFPNVGKSVEYQIGKQVTSQAPGFWCLRDRPEYISPYQTVLEVRIPAGSRAYLGTDGGYKVILAEKLTPIKVTR